MTLEEAENKISELENKLNQSYLDRYKIWEIENYLKTIESKTHYDVLNIKEYIEKILKEDTKNLISWTKSEILNERDRLWGLINELDYELFRREEHM